MQKINARPALLAAPFRTPQTREDLQAMAQLAVQVEFTTIPTYLTTMYSIIDKQADVYQTLRSVAIEEMLHLVQVANLLVAIGGKPVLSTTTVAPQYPCYLPSANKLTTPFIGLQPASSGVIENVFVAIETPAPYDAPAEGSHYQSIAQLYKALEDGLIAFVNQYGEAALFKTQPGAAQLEGVYLGKFGGRIIQVKDLKSARHAIAQIVQQGEGSDTPLHTTAPVERWGTYNAYGLRSDGTNGPLLNNGREQSHYFKFIHAAAASPFPDAYPIISNPGLRPEYDNSDAQAMSDLFDGAYTLMLRALEASFDTRYGSNLYFSLALPFMHEVLPSIALAMMNTPINSDGDSSIGPNACPAYVVRDNTSLDEWLKHCAAIQPQLVNAIPDASPGNPALRLLARGQQLQAVAKAAHLSL